MRVFNLLVVLVIIYSTVSFGNVCSDVNCPNGRTPTAICFADPTPGEPIRRASHYATCGYFTEIVVTTNTTTIKDKLRQLATSCKSLDRITFKGHADDGYHFAGGLDSGTVQELAPYSCLLNKDATVQFSGCSVGRGCSGDMLFYKTATSLLAKGGNVYGDTFYSSTFLPGVIPHFSLNGKYRKLIYNPTSRPPDSWTQTGIALTNGGTINERCSGEMSDLLENLESAKSKAQRKNCSSSVNYISNDNLTSYRRIQSRLSTPPPYLQSASSDAWYNLSSALDTLKYQIHRYEQCEPPARGAESSSTKAVQ